MKVDGKGAQKIFGKNDVNLVEYPTEDGKTVIRIDENGNRARDFAELDKFKDVDEFFEKSFSMIKEEMGLADLPIKFEIKAMPAN